MINPVPPQIPNRYDDDEQRLRRLEAQESEGRRRSLLLFVGGWLVLAALIPFALTGWAGVGLVLVPIGLGMILGGGLQLFTDRLGE